MTPGPPEPVAPQPDGDQPQVEHLLGLMTLLLGQITAQQDVRDRWFRYYLAITAGTLTFATSALKLFISQAPRRELYAILAATLFLTGVIGYSFYCLYLRQRRNYVSHYLLLRELQEQLIARVTAYTYESFYGGGRPFDRPARGADYYTLLAQSLLASAYFGAGAAMAVSALSSFSAISLYVAFATTSVSVVGFGYTRVRFEHAG